MPFKNNMQCLYFLSIALFVSQSNIVHAASLDILSFQKTAFSKSEQTQVCQQIQQLCDNQQQWRSLKSPDQKLWLLSGDNIAAFQHTKTGLKLLASWHVNVASQQDAMANQPFIFPKLFPMAKHRYAIAVIHPFSEMYSGGGASIERADFYELQSNGTTRQFIKNYPFSFNRMIRACFSAEDYEQSDGLCHDEDGLSLDIRPIKPMHWQFRYQYGLSVSPTSDSGEKSHKDRRNINIDLNKVPLQPNIPTIWNYAGQE